MLSKMKVASMATAGAVERARSPLSGRASDLSEDIEDHNEDNDSNNNNSTNINNNNNNNNNNDIKSFNYNNNNNNNNNGIIAISKSINVSSKKSKDELLDIVETARRRRLPKDCADNLASFIRWSFSHLPIDPSMQRLQENLYGLGAAEKLAVLQAACAAATAAGGGNIDQVLEDTELIDVDDQQTINEADEDVEEVEDSIDNQHDIIDEIEQTRQGSLRNRNMNSSNNNNNANNDADADDDDDEVGSNWRSSPTGNHSHSHNQHNNQQHFGLNRFSDQLLRQHAKLNHNLSGGSPFANVVAGGSSAANLALMRSSDLHKALNLRNDFKRARTNLYLPDTKPYGSPFNHNIHEQRGQSLRKTSAGSAGGYLGNVVERLHQQQQLQLQQQQQANLKLEQQQHAEAAATAAEAAALAAAASINNNNNSNDINGSTGNNNELSFHLQQFLQQQTSLEDLCSSVGIEENNQLVLAAAIHRALVDSVGGNGTTPAGTSSSQLSQALNHSNQDNNSTMSKQQQSNTHTSNAHHNHNKQNSNSNNNHQTTLHNNNNSSSSHHQLAAESMGATGPTANRQRRTYNTRASMLSAANNNQSLGNNQHGRQTTLGLSSSTNNTSSANLALVSNRAQQQRHAQAAAALSALASGGTGNNNNHHNLQQQQQTALSSSTPMVDFECDTCGSSFDDRHRLMQHQSIHLELKKDWFTETPVDEVMKIFNRRRGEFLCNTCNLRFEATFDYDKHNHLEHGPRPYCCQFCGNGTRTFRFWRQYLNHLYDHRYIFSCTIDDCDFTVNRRDSLRFHIFRFHLNCQLPQNSPSSISASAAAVAAAALQHQQLRGIPTRAMMGVDNKWDDDDMMDANDMSIVE